MRPREKPLPFVPRPFVEEPLGGWLGRIAGFYRMDIDELSAELGVDLGLPSRCRDWLFLPPQPLESLTRIGYLTHTAPTALRALEVDESWRTSPSRYWFCRSCLFVNPLDVSSPRWIKDWLNPDNETCAVHGDLENLESGDLSRHRNFNALLKLVSADSNIWQTRVEARRRRIRGGR